MLYGAVVAGGPKWSKGSSNCFGRCHAADATTSQVETAPKFTDTDAKALSDWIRDRNPSLEDIDEYIRKTFRQPMTSHP